MNDYLSGVPFPGEGPAPWIAFAERPDEAYEFTIRSLAAGMLHVVDSAEKLPSKTGFGQWLRDQIAERFASAFDVGEEGAWFTPTGFQWAAAQNELHRLRGTPSAKLALAGETHPSALVLAAGDYDPKAVERPKRAPAKKKTAKKPAAKKPAAKKTTAKKTTAKKRAPAKKR